MKIAVFTNFEKCGADEITKQVIYKLSELKVEVLLPCDLEVSDCTVLSEEEIFKTADAVITVGGDGTLIGYAKKAAEKNIPVLGINAGRLGFLTDIESDNIDLLENLVSGNYKIENRMMLLVKIIEDGKVKFCEAALNDVIIAGVDIGRLADINVSIGEDVINYRADGIIISTPTGSTAYSMSAGGPIIDPAVRCIDLTPICSHSLTARPILIRDEDIITVSIPESSRVDAYLAVDGNRYGEIRTGDNIIIEKSAFDAKLINLSGRTIYKTLSLKF